MDTKRISELLTEMGIAHFLDNLNPSYTVHLPSGASIDAADINGPWEIVSVDRKKQVFVVAEQELINEISSFI